MRIRKSIFMLLVLVMVLPLGTNSVTAFVQENEHIHDDTCGYVEAVDGRPCLHEHDASCGYAEAVPEIPCDIGCIDEDGDGIVDHKEGCAYQAAIPESPCQHVYNADCGYIEAIEGHPCPFVLAEGQAHNVDDLPELTELDTQGTTAFVYSDKNAATVLSLLGVDAQTDGIALESCRLRAYYVQYKNAIASEKTSTTLNLIGNGLKTKQTVKYQLQFHNDIDLDAGEVSIKLPYVLYTDRYGEAVIPSDIGVPAAPAQSPVSSFNYTLITEGGIEYIVFNNCKPIRSGPNNVIQVLYQLDDIASVDEQSAWSLQPELSVAGSSRLCDEVLTGNMDTSTNLELTDKIAYIDESNIYPEMYTWNQVCAVTHQYTEEPEDFAAYRCVLWRTGVDGVASQPWDLTVTDTPFNN